MQCMKNRAYTHEGTLSSSFVLRSDNYSCAFEQGKVRSDNYSCAFEQGKDNVSLLLRV
jgi:hypothetical protein